MPLLRFRNVLVAGSLVISAFALARSAEIVSTPPQEIFNATTSDLPKTSSANVRVYTGSIASGDSTLWHVHSSPPIVYVESGTATWEYKGGRPADSRTPGQVMLEPANVTVRVANRGTTALRVVMVSISAPGEPFFRRAP